jgi:hypothetical protein
VLPVLAKMFLKNFICDIPGSNPDPLDIDQLLWRLCQQDHIFLDVKNDIVVNVHRALKALLFLNLQQNNTKRPSF